MSVRRTIRRRSAGLAAVVAVAAGVALSLPGDNTVSGRDALTETAAKKAITKLLTTQKDAWNRGSIDGFMEHYWQSDDLTFSSGGNTTRGWAATRERYKRRYATREQMGTLDFGKLEFQLLGESAALVLGRWKLERKAGPIGGNFSLVLRKTDGRWLIIHDHTSVLEEPAPVSDSPQKPQEKESGGEP